MRYLWTVFLLALCGCASSPAPPYADAYREALVELPGSPQDAATIGARFTRLYASLGSPGLAEQAAELYAESLYFNDTLTTLRSRIALIPYLQKTGERITGMQVELLSAVADGNDIYLRWSMRFDFKVGWRTITSKTVGMSHLRVNEQGQVVMHQDFWDSAEGIYRHLPLIGVVVGRS